MPRITLGSTTRIKEIIAKHIDQIDNNEFVDLYMAMPNSWHSECTSILHSAGIYPEYFMNHLPICWLKNNDDVSQVKIPPNIKTIGGEAFRDCINLHDLNLGRVEVIGTKAFMQCSSLARVIIPTSVTIIAGDAFADNEIKFLYYEGTKEEWAKIDVAYTAFRNADVKYVSCEDGSVLL